MFNTAHCVVHLAQGNVFSNVGVEIKQAGGLYSALSANHTLKRNIIFNGPRAGVNINDGAHGGHTISENLFFNLVRETSDHGALNTWDREPYLQTWNGSTPARQLFFPRRIPPSIPVLARACLWCLGARTWRVNLLRGVQSISNPRLTPRFHPRHADADPRAVLPPPQLLREHALRDPLPGPRRREFRGEY